jgi:3-oxoacyl-[acyl-carrier-protein] synthase-3
MIDQLFMISAVISSTGSYIPETVVPNSAFLTAEFFENGSKLKKTSDDIITKFQSITGISERRYARKDQVASDLGLIAAKSAINSAAIDPETIDYIIVAHNFGDVRVDTNRVDMVPTLSSKIKAGLKISNPGCVAYDLPFGCPGWVEGLIQANYFIKAGDAKRCLVIGAETLSRVIDPHDVDSMIFSDGAGATILEAANSSSGILAHKSETHALQYYDLLNMESSNSPFVENKSDLYLKMKGRKVYEFALTKVPLLIKATLDKAKVDLSEIKKIFIHQANDKMDQAIAERLFQLYGMNSLPSGIMPMTIGFLGNSSVATVPTLLDLVLRGQIPGQSIGSGDKVVFASVGAGMNINAIVYQV